MHRFWVGLMDGLGSLQVNHFRNRKLNHRIAITLEDTPANREMLDLFALHIGGRSLPEKTGFYEWVALHRTQCEQVFKVYDKYPPLDPHMIHKSVFFWESLAHIEDMGWYKRNRPHMSEYGGALDKLPSPLDRPYFPEWLSGFIEAQGTFDVRNNGNHSFSVGKKDGEFLLSAVQDFLETKALVRRVPYKGHDNYYYLETYDKIILRRLVQHLETYPLLGQKAVSFREFRDKLM